MKWIKVEDELPHDAGDWEQFLVTEDFNNEDYGCKSVAAAYFRELTNGGYAWIYVTNEHIINQDNTFVTHWMRFPEPA